MARFRNPSGPLLIFAAALLVSAAAGAQTTRTERFRFTHPAPSTVAGFNLYYGTAAGSYTQLIDLGKPQTSSGAYVVDVAFPSTQGVYVAVTAYDASQRESARSNEKFRPGTTSGGGGTTAQSAVTGFALWSATTDSITDSNFTSGERIELASLPCAAIQIKTNSYLGAHATPGSVKKIFDGRDLGCSSAPESHENSPPYAWETDHGVGEYNCAPTLTVPGRHTLVAIPYDGDDCTGKSGSAVTLTFDVIGTGSTPPPPGPTLGKPGQPVLIQ